MLPPPRLLYTLSILDSLFFFFFSFMLAMLLLLLLLRAIGVPAAAALNVVNDTKSRVRICDFDAC